MEAPNIYENDPSDLDRGKSVAQLCEEVTRKAFSALFPEQKVIDVKKDEEDSMMCHSWFVHNMDYFLPMVYGKARRMRLKEKRDRLAASFEKTRFKEYYSVKVDIERAAIDEDRRAEHEIAEQWKKVLGDKFPKEMSEKEQTIREYWLVAVDHDFEEVCIMRDMAERSNFFRSLGPEFHDMSEACEAFRNECMKWMKSAVSKAPDK